MKSRTRNDINMNKSTRFMLQYRMTVLIEKSKFIFILPSTFFVFYFFFLDFNFSKFYLLYINVQLVTIYYAIQSLSIPDMGFHATKDITTSIKISFITQYGPTKISQENTLNMSYFGNQLTNFELFQSFPFYTAPIFGCRIFFT